MAEVSYPPLRKVEPNSRLFAKLITIYFYLLVIQQIKIVRIQNIMDVGIVLLHFSLLREKVDN